MNYIVYILNVLVQWKTITICIFFTLKVEIIGIIFFLISKINEKGSKT